jgi:hypothetical protein
MKDDNVNSYSSHQEIMLLLPWFVNKTLDDAETKAVEKHLKVCLICKREVADLNKLSLAIKQADTLDAVAQASFSRLQARIHGHGNSRDQAAPPATGENLRGQKKPRKFDFALPIFRYQAIAALALCLLSIPAYLIINRQLENDYRTLANAEITLANDDEIRVVFSESVDSGRRKSVIDSIAGEIVEGPNAMGVYLIRLKQTADAGQVLGTLAALKKNPQVIFAEPAFSLSTALADEEKPQ